jgi:hypothetical protein
VGICSQKKNLRYNAPIIMGNPGTSRMFRYRSGPCPVIPPPRFNHDGPNVPRTMDAPFAACSLAACRLQPSTGSQSTPPYLACSRAGVDVRRQLASRVTIVDLLFELLARQHCMVWLMQTTMSVIGGGSNVGLSCLAAQREIAVAASTHDPQRRYSRVSAY